MHLVKRGFIGVCAILMLTKGGKAEKAPIKNGAMNVTTNSAAGKIKHQSQWTPANWELSKNKDAVCQAWNADIDGWAVKLHNGSLKQPVSAPTLGSEHREAKANDYHGLLTFDLLGFSEKPTKYQVKITDSYGKKALVTVSGVASKPAKKNPAIDWKIKGASSLEHRDFDSSLALDGDDKTFWLSADTRIGGKGSHIILDLGKTQTIRGITYLPRQDRENRGRIKKYEIYISKEGSVWSNKPIVRGIFPKGRSLQEVKFPKLIASRFIKLTSVEDYTGRAGAAVAEFKAITSSSSSKERHVSQRICKIIPREVLAQMDQFNIEITVRGAGSVVFDNVALYWLPEKPTGKMYGSPNKESGPDAVAAGLFGFEGYSIHGHSPLPVTRIFPGSPAEKAGLKQGDIIIGINDSVLPETDCNPGWNWFANGHEPVLGRIAVETLKSRRFGKRKTAPVYLNVASATSSKMKRLRLEIAPYGHFSKYFPLKMESIDKAIYNDIIGFLVKHQRSDGSFCEKYGGRPTISTSLGAMGLLGTKNPKYLPKVKKAVDWVIAKYESGKGMGFWDMAYCGTFLCEWYYATGDKRVIPWIETTLDWLPTVMHKSKWGMEIWGHGASGIPYGDKSLIAPTAHMEIFGALAYRCCGIKNKLWDVAADYIEYTWSNPEKGGHGAMGYNASMKDTGQAWSRTGNIAIAVSVLGIRKDYQKGFLGYLRNYYPVMRNSHAYGYPGAQWGLIGLYNLDQRAFRDVMQEWTWDFALAWEPGFGLRFSQPHMGAPYMGAEAIVNPAYATMFSVVNRGLYITGNRKRFWARGK